jgi:hypothetical protein
MDSGGSGYDPAIDKCEHGSRNSTELKCTFQGRSRTMERSSAKKLTDSVASQLAHLVAAVLNLPSKSLMTEMNFHVRRSVLVCD